jgi:hypothetical protein
MKYKIIKSTKDKYEGKTFETEELTVACLSECLQHSFAGKIKREGDFYVYSDGHIILLIKEVN